MTTRLELFIWSCWVNAAFSFAMVALVMFSRPITKVKLYWILSCLVVGFWSISLGSMSQAKDYSLALWGTKAVTGFSLWIPVFIFHMVHSLTQRQENKSLIAAYSSTLVLSILNLTGFLNDVRPIGDFLFYTSAKPLYFLFPLQLYSLFIASGWLLWKSSQIAPPAQKKQLLLLLAGIELGLLGGQTTFPQVFDIDFFPWGNFFNPVYVVLVAYGMMKHQFMDFRLAAKKLSLLITIYVCLGILALPFVLPALETVFTKAPAIRLSLAFLILVYTFIIALGGGLYAFLLQRSFWLKSHMTMGLTHELKSPLASIRGAVDFLTHQMKNIPLPNAKTPEYLDIIKRNTIRLEVFVNDLLNIASIQEENISLDRKPFSLVEVVKSVSEIYEPMMTAKGLTFRLQFEEGNSYTINADEGKIRQVISNLLSNALKFSTHGTIEVTLVQTHNEIQCSVSDEGPGIKPENINKVFDRFYQENAGVKGAGLGLAIAKAWVEAHGGRIWVEDFTKRPNPETNFTTSIKFTLLV